jgi:hypothetical protein
VPLPTTSPSLRSAPLPTGTGVVTHIESLRTASRDQLLCDAVLLLLLLLAVVAVAPYVSFRAGASSVRRSSNVVRLRSDPNMVGTKMTLSDRIRDGCVSRK